DLLMLAVLRPDMERLDTSDLVVDRSRDGQDEMDGLAGGQPSRRGLRRKGSAAPGYGAARAWAGGLGAAAGQHDGDQQQEESVHSGMTVGEGQKFRGRGSDPDRRIVIGRSRGPFSGPSGNRSARGRSPMDRPAQPPSR